VDTVAEKLIKPLAEDVSCVLYDNHLKVSNSTVSSRIENVSVISMDCD
jgi:hypothetical protein